MGYWHPTKIVKLSGILANQENYFLQDVLVLTALHTVKGVFTNLICSGEYFLFLKMWMSSSLWDQECLHSSEENSGFTFSHSLSFMSAFCLDVCGKMLWIFWPAEEPGSKGILLLQPLEGDTFLRQKLRTCMHVTTLEEIIFLLWSGSHIKLSLAHLLWEQLSMSSRIIKCITKVPPSHGSSTTKT